jgi:hypothetical protein
MPRRSVGALVLAAVGAVGVAGGETSPADKAQVRPVLKLRATPGVALPPVQVLLTAELVGGGEHEDFHCPEVEWDFSDGSRSTFQSDCQPLSDAAPIERRFTRRHAYRVPGDYAVVVTLRQTGRIVAQARATVLVQGGSGDSSGPYAAALQ